MNEIDAALYLFANIEGGHTFWSNQVSEHGSLTVYERLLSGKYDPVKFEKLVTNLRATKLDEIKESIFSDYIQRISINFKNDKLKISIISPRHRRMNRYWDIRTQFEKFMSDLFQKYGYNKDSFELDFV